MLLNVDISFLIEKYISLNNMKIGNFMIGLKLIETKEKTII